MYEYIAERESLSLSCSVLFWCRFEMPLFEKASSLYAGHSNFIDIGHIHQTHHHHAAFGNGQFIACLILACLSYVSIEHNNITAER